MIPVARYVRSLQREAPPGQIEGVTIRNYRGLVDIPAWLALRERAFAGESPAVGGWTEHDFHREFLSKPWWQPERMWFAETNGDVVGAVTMGRHGRGDDATPTIHWLMVDPEHRRRGVARSLVAALESQAFREGYREIHLETHIGWNTAVGFYESLGYRPL